MYGYCNFFFFGICTLQSNRVTEFLLHTQFLLYISKSQCMRTAFKCDAIFAKHENSFWSHIKTVRIAQKSHRLNCSGFLTITQFKKSTFQTHYIFLHELNKMVNAHMSDWIFSSYLCFAMKSNAFRCSNDIYTKTKNLN